MLHPNSLISSQMQYLIDGGEVLAQHVRLGPVGRRTPVHADALSVRAAQESGRAHAAGLAELRADGLRRRASGLTGRVAHVENFVSVEAHVWNRYTCQTLHLR